MILSTCPKKENREQLAAISLVCFAACLLLAITLNYWLCHPLTCAPDQALYINMGDLLLSGWRPYVEMYDNNPPLIIYLNVIPAMVAHVFALPPTLGFSLSVCAVSFVTLALSTAVLVHSGVVKDRKLSLAASASVLALAYFDLNQRIDFGQREHLFVLLYLPFFYLRYARSQNCRCAPKSLCILIGVLAGIAIALKHYFLIVAAAPEIVWFLMRRDPRLFFKSEIYACALTILLYLLHFFFLDRQILSGLFDFIVPIYREGYSYYTNSFVYNLTTVWRTEFLYFFIAATLALVLSPLACDSGALLFGLLAFGFASLVIYLLAGQSWQYHVLPVRFAACAALFVESGLLLSWMTKSSSRKRLLYTALLLCGLAGYCGWNRCVEYLYEEENHDKFDLSLLGFRGTAYATEMSPFAEKILAETKRGDSVLFISPAMSPGYPAIVQTGRRPASRYLHGLTFPLLDAVVQTAGTRNRAGLAALQGKMVREYGEDIKDNQPRLIFIDRMTVNDRLRDFGFQATYMKNYKVVDDITGILVYKREGD